jgi:mannosyltransferase OCH1-like enzyme
LAYNRKVVMAIPKIIHYCWFGTNKLPETAKKCIESWKKYFSDYEIKEWNESNYEVNKIIFTKEAYEVKKYAFVTDYARFDILYNYGGIYFDTDVEVIKSFADILLNKAFMGFERRGHVASGLGFGAEPNNAIFLKVLNYYRKQHFILRNNAYNTKTVVSIVSEILKEYGLKNEDIIQDVAGIRIYPEEYFSPKSFITGITTITAKTHSIHHFEGSWVSENEQKLVQERWDFYAKYGNDEYVVNMHNRLAENIPLKKLYKIAIKRTIKKLLGKK